MRQSNVLSLVLLSWLIVGCNQSLKIEKIVSIDPTFQGYVDDFVSESRAVGRPIVIDNLSIHFSTSLDPNTLGECFSYNEGMDGTPRIVINQQDWPFESVTKQRVILFHEMGHCVLWREHVTTVLPSGIVTSIMYPYIQNDNMYLNNWAYYMHELFYGF